MLSLPLTITLHLHCGRWRPILYPLYGTLCNYQKILKHQRHMYHDYGINLFSVEHHINRGTLSYSSSQGFNWYFPQTWGINMVAICLLLKMWHYPPWMEVHVCVYLFSYWLISFTIGYQEVKRQRTLQNLPLLYNRN